MSIYPTLKKKSEAHKELFEVQKRPGLKRSENYRSRTAGTSIHEVSEEGPLYFGAQKKLVLSVFVTSSARREGKKFRAIKQASISFISWQTEVPDPCKTSGRL